MFELSSIKLGFVASTICILGCLNAEQLTKVDRPSVCSTENPKADYRFHPLAYASRLGSRLKSTCSVFIQMFRVLLVLYGCETWSLTLREEHRLEGV
jgi:hypothetical protein